MINLKLSSAPAKNSPNFGARLIKWQIVKNVHLIKILKHFYKITLFSYYVVSCYERENANKALLIDFDRRAIINQN